MAARSPAGSSTPRAPARTPSAPTRCAPSTFVSLPRSSPARGRRPSWPPSTAWTGPPASRASPRCSAGRWERASARPVPASGPRRADTEGRADAPFLAAFPGHSTCPPRPTRRAGSSAAVAALRRYSVASVLGRQRPSLAPYVAVTGARGRGARRSRAFISTMLYDCLDQLLNHRGRRRHHRHPHHPRVVVLTERLVGLE